MGVDPVASLITFIHDSPSPYHAVAATADRLREVGFQALDESCPWELQPEGRYYVVRGESSIVAFIRGAKTVAEAGFAMIGAHTDSPNLRLKPRCDFAREGYAQLGIEVYGGVLLASWVDRDLGLSGRLILDDGQGGRESKRVLVDRPVARIPELAIHLDRDVNDRGLKLDKQRHMAPVVGLELPGGLLEWLASETGLGDASRILGFDLMLHVLERPAIGGVNGEFLFAPRLDNLASCHAALEALARAAETPAAATRVISFHDHEEVGSGSSQGASGSFLGDVLERLNALEGGGVQGFQTARAKSMLLSADMAHAVHPNYAERHDPRHMPRIGEGPVVKINANMRYATDGSTEAEFVGLCEDVDVPVQKFVMRSDLACGSTIGPLISTRLGVPCVDIGNPMLSMHSSREMAGTRDHEQMIRVMTRFFESR